MKQLPAKQQPPERRGRDIQERTFRFAKRVLTLVRALPNDHASTMVARQLARSGASVGANVEEAEAAHSKAEFIRKMNIARGEARETRYWLRLVAELECVAASRLTGLLQESEEILKVLTKIVANARKAAKS